MRDTYWKGITIEEYTSTTASTATKYEPGLFFFSVNTNFFITIALPIVPDTKMNAYSVSWYISLALYGDRAKLIWEEADLPKNNGLR